MQNAEYYLELPYDLSGSMAKNRFRNELLWGLKKIFDLHRENKEYTVVFDFCCDIEVHLKECFEFYQIKTDNKSGSYTSNRMIKPNKQGKSVLGKLYVLKYNDQGSEHDNIKIAVVSNVPFNDGKKSYNSSEILDLNTINEDSIKTIKNKLKSELNINQDLNFKNIFFIRTGIDLFNPEKSLIGETAQFFEEIFGCEPKKINSLYRVLALEINSKACYELELNDYNEILKNKGIGKEYLNKILIGYIDKTDDAVNKSKKFIDEIYKNNFKNRLKKNRILTQLLIDLKNNKYLQKLEQKIVEYINLNIDTLPDEDIEIINHISQLMYDDSIKEVTVEDIEVLTLLIIKRSEEGVYEEFNNK